MMGEIKKPEENWPDEQVISRFPAAQMYRDKFKFIGRGKELDQAFGFFMSHINEIGTEGKQGKIATQRIDPLQISSISGYGKTRFGIEFAILVEQKQLDRHDPFDSSRSIWTEFLFLSLNGLGETLNLTGIDKGLEKEYVLSQRILANSMLGMSVLDAHAKFGKKSLKQNAHEVLKSFVMFTRRFRHLKETDHVLLFIQMDELPLLRTGKETWKGIHDAIESFRTFNEENSSVFLVLTHTAFLHGGSLPTVSNWKTITLRPLLNEQMRHLLFAGEGLGQFENDMKPDERRQLDFRLALTNGLTLCVTDDVVQEAIKNVSVGKYSWQGVFWGMNSVMSKRARTFSDKFASVSEEDIKKLMEYLFTGMIFMIPKDDSIDPFLSMLRECGHFGVIQLLDVGDDSFKVTVPYPFLLELFTHELEGFKGFKGLPPHSDKIETFAEKITAAVFVVRINSIVRIGMTSPTLRHLSLPVNGLVEMPLDYVQLLEPEHLFWTKEGEVVESQKIEWVGKNGVFLLASTSLSFDVMVAIPSHIILIQVKSGGTAPKDVKDANSHSCVIAESISSVDTREIVKVWLTYQSCNVQALGEDWVVLDNEVLLSLLPSSVGGIGRFGKRKSK